MHALPRGLAYAIYYTVLAAIEVPVNLVAIVTLSRGRCGLSRCVTWYLMSMAVADLLVIITAVILNRIPGIYFPASFLSITPICSLSIALSYASRDSSVWLTVAFTFDRFVAICCQKLKTKYCIKKTAVVVIGMACSIGCLKSVPWYFIHEPIYIINNVPWYCSLKQIRYTSHIWRAFDWFDRILTPCTPFLLIILLNALTVRHILAARRGCRRLRAPINGLNQRDLEMESRRRSIILLFAVSGSFILLWMTYVVQFFYERITNAYQIMGFSDPKFILQESGNLLQLLSSCANTFNHAITQNMENSKSVPSQLTFEPIRMTKSCNFRFVTPSIWNDAVNVLLLI
ncbi:probable G-protein coupled receptor 139 [Heterodontus francisci]|uniref:probable G-protein coupled receptor 139 n=1 Tax=Heterodontus francisci TaxID=7792 RepID=UPI00355BA3C4